MSACQNSKTCTAVTSTWRQNLGRTALDLSVPRNASWWTGLQPQSCPGYSAAGKLHSLPILNLATCSRQQVLDYFNNTWTLTELLFSGLVGDESFYRPPYHSLRHPLIFYYVHPAVLYINKFQMAGLLQETINPHYERLFETGVDEMSWDDMSKNDIQWPTVDESRDYRQQAYKTIVSIIESHPDLADGHQPLMQDHPLWSLFMGLEHERIHLETSSVLIRELPIENVARPAAWPDDEVVKREASVLHSPSAGKDYPINEMVEVKAQSVSLGKSFDWPSYGWDNEYGSRVLDVKEFAASKFLVSNGEFWNFVADGGYKHSENWTEHGWRWRSFRDILHPTFWVPQGSGVDQSYKLRTCFEQIDMRWDWPVIVNYHEAEAFAIWKSKKENRDFGLLSEAQQHALRNSCDFEFSDRNELNATSPFNISLKYGSESSVDTQKNKDSAPFFDLFGNVWQWSEDHFNPLEGSKTHPYYLDFSTPCYDGKHQMIFGGSFISTGDEASPWARFHFRPHFFQHAGIRLLRR